MYRKTVLVLSVLLLVSCKNRESANNSITATAPPATSPAAATTATASEVHPTVAVQQEAPYGEYLTDDTGRTLYIFMADPKGSAASKCDLRCAKEWPPFSYEGEFKASGDAQSSMLGKLTRPDGSTQITYNGRPLYYYNKDKAPGDVDGQGVKDFGAEWYIVSPQGEKVEGGEKKGGSKS